MEYVDFFDYNNVNQDHEAAVREVAKWLQTVEKNDTLATKVIHRFKLEERKKVEIEDSIFYQYIKEFGGLFFNVQGYLQTDTGYDIPHCTVCATSQDLDAFFHWAVRKRLNEITEEERERMSGMLPPGVSDNSMTTEPETSSMDDAEVQMLNDINNLNG
jgi:hypothetical protein